MEHTNTQLITIVGLFAFLHSPNTEKYIKSHRNTRMTDKENTNKCFFFAASAVAADIVVVMRNCLGRCFFGLNFIHKTQWTYVEQKKIVLQNNKQKKCSTFKVGNSVGQRWNKK